MGNSLWLVFTKCTDPAREAEFNKWYDEVHLPDLLEVPQITAARRFKLAGPANKNQPDAQYLAVYEIDSDDPEAVRKTAMTEHSPKWRDAGRVIDCIASVAQTTFTGIGAHQTSSGTAKAALLVMSACTDPAREAEFNKWYDEIHIPDVTATPHIYAGQRYKLAGSPSKTEPDARYLAVYELDTDDTGAAMKGLGAEMQKVTAAGRMIDCIQVVSGTTYAAVGARQQAKASV